CRSSALLISAPLWAATPTGGSSTGTPHDAGRSMPGGPPTLFQPAVLPGTGGRVAERWIAADLPEDLRWSPHVLPRQLLEGLHELAVLSDGSAQGRVARGGLLLQSARLLALRLRPEHACVVIHAAGKPRGEDLPRALLVAA